MTPSSGSETTAVLLMGYGSPNGANDLPSYLEDVLHGQRPSAEMVAEYVRRYDRIDGSPQNRILTSLREKLERRLGRAGPGPRVFLGVKHGHPALRDVIPEVARAGFRELIAVPLSPYASTWISEPYREGVAEGIGAAATPIEVDVRLDWHLDPNWIGYWQRAIRAEPLDPTDAVLLSAHSLPQRMRDRGDPYPEILHETSDAIARAARLPRWSFTFQSAGNTTESWLGPDITEVMLDWKRRGSQRQWVASFGFVFDHLEVLYDLDVVVREFAETHGIEYRRVPMPNDAEEVVEALAARVLLPPSSATPPGGVRPPPAEAPRIPLGAPDTDRGRERARPSGRSPGDLNRRATFSPLFSPGDGLHSDP
ncbi:MAG: ferrochelatase [Thermoplasmata archaeon]